VRDDAREHRDGRQEPLAARWRGPATNYTREWARQFAYDDPRARFMDRDVDPGTYEPNFADPAANRWTDYAGVIPWGDFAL